MKMIRNCLLAMGLAACLPLQTHAAVSGLTPEAKADFEWFSGLGFHDVSNAWFARVATGSWFQSGGDPPKASYVLGFVLSTNGSTFTALDIDLFQRNYTTSAAGMAEYQRVGFELISLKEWAGVLLDYYEKPRERDVEADLWRRFGERVTERSQIFVLAWACWQQGLEDEARRLYAVAQTTPKPTGRDDSGLSIRSKLEKDLGLSMMWRAILEFGNPAITRKDLLAQFQAIATNYPGSEYHAQAESTAERLKIMLAEDEQHAKSPPKPLSELPTEERIKELIFQLRDQNGQQWSQPGWCDIFNDPRGTNTPAHQLVSIGYPAVPQLIAALDNPTFTRSVGYHRNFYFSHTVLTVGDCAAFILNRIAGKAFYEPQSTSSYLSKDGNVVQVRQDAQAWWAAFQSKGEKQMLVEATEAGNAPGQAQLLWQRYPEAAVDAVIKGARASTNQWHRVQMIELLAKSAEPPVNVFLEQELEKGPFLQSRAAAASVLAKRGRPEAVAVMIQVWTNSGAAAITDEHGVGSVMQFLAHADSPEAIEALHVNFFQHSVGDQLQLVEYVGGEYGSQKQRSAATSSAVEKFLVSVLQDEEVTSMSGTMGDKPLNNPRICDMAGFYLNKNWPNRYEFDLAASLKVRERQRLVCQNIWRKANQLPELPLPQARTIELAPGEANKVVAIEWAEGGVAPDKDFADRVEALKDKLITPGDIVGVLTAYTSKPAGGTGGIQLRVRKDEDLTGVTISVGCWPASRRDEARNGSRCNRVQLSAKKPCWECSVGCSWITLKKREDGRS